MARTIIGLDLLNRKLAAMPKATRAEIRKVLQVSAAEMVTLAKALVPVDSGVLRDSVRSEPGEHELAIVVRAGGEATTVAARDGQGDYDYSLGIEFGTSEMPEQPYFWNSFRAIKKKAKGRATRAIRRAARAAAGV